VNRRRLIYPAAVLVVGALVMIGDRLMNAERPEVKRTPAEPFVPSDFPAGTMAPAPKKPQPPVGRPPDVPPAPGEPAMSGTLQVEPTPVAPSR